jgi:hypothetical protein
VTELVVAAPDENELIIATHKNSPRKRPTERL